MATKTKSANKDAKDVKAKTPLGIHLIVSARRELLKLPGADLRSCWTGRWYRWFRRGALPCHILCCRTSRSSRRTRRHACVTLSTRSRSGCSSVGPDAMGSASSQLWLSTPPLTQLRLRADKRSRLHQDRCDDRAEGELPRAVQGSRSRDFGSVKLLRLLSWR